MDTNQLSKLEKLIQETHLIPSELKFILGIHSGKKVRYATIDEALSSFRNAKSAEQEFDSFVSSVEIARTPAEIKRILSVAVNENQRLVALKKWLDLASTPAMIKEVYVEAPYGSLVFYLAIKKLASAFGLKTSNLENSLA